MDKETKLKIRSEINRQARIQRAKIAVKESDILTWGQCLFPDKFNLSFCDELHNYIVDISEEHLTATLAPRGHAKSTIFCFLIPLYLALNHPERYKHFINIQNTSNKAISINLSIRQELEENEDLKELYGDQYSEAKWTEKQFVLQNGIIFSSCGAGESIRGKNYNQIRPDYFILDDLYDEDDIYSLPRVLKKNNWVWSTAYNARAKNKKTCFHLLGTAINRNDILHECLKKSNVKSKIFKAIIDYNTEKVLWPELNSFKDLMKEKETVGSTIFARELQNEVRDDENSIIKEHQIKYYDGQMGTDFEVIEKILGVDPSIGENKKSDSTGMCVTYKVILKGTKTYYYFIKDIINERLSLEQRKATIQSLHNRYLFNSVRIEAVSGFNDFAEYIRLNTNVPVKRITVHKNKIARLELESNKFENGKVFINKNIEYKKLQEFIDQIINNEPNHDDVRDSMLLTLNESYSKINFIKI